MSMYEQQNDKSGASRQRVPIRGLAAMFSIASILFILLGTSSVSADIDFTGDRTINNGQAYELTIIMPTAGPLPFTVDVYSGPNIDIILVDAANLQKWKDGNSYTYYRGGTFFDSSHATGNAWLEAGTYYLILSNEYKLFGGGPATVHYSYTPTTIGSTDVGGGGNSGLSSGPVLLLLLVAIAVIAAVAYLAVHQGKTESKTVGQTGPEEASLTASNHDGNGPRYCRYCGSLVNGEGAYCPKCGKKSE